MTTKTKIIIFWLNTKIGNFIIKKVHPNRVAKNIDGEHSFSTKEGLYIGNGFLKWQNI